MAQNTKRFKVSILAAVIPVIVGSLCALTSGVPALASGHALIEPGARSAPARPASPAALAGYVYWGSPGVVRSSYSESHEAIAVDNYATGAYTVTFDGLGGITGGDVQVTPGANASTCSALWTTAGANLQVNVWCFALGGGDAENAPFSLLVTEPRAASRGTYDYAYVYRDASSGTLTGAYQYNSAHKKNSVRHLGTGRYQVTLGGPRSSDTKGTVKVTPWGNGPGGCNVTRWHGSSAGELVDVDCFSAAFALRNRSFTLVYAASSNLMNLSGATDANAYASSRAVVYQPKVQYDSRRGARVTVVEYNPGEYGIVFAGGSQAAGANPGDIQVTTIGTGRQCTFSDWDQEFTPFAYVYCYTGAGNLARAAFTIQWVVA